MATSGSSSVAVTSYDTLKFTWTADSQSIANNTTTISWKLLLVSGAYGRINSAGTKAWSVTIDGTTYSGSASVAIGNNTTKQLASGTATIKHNSDGSKTFSYSYSQSFSGITFSGVALGTVSRSATGTLDTIPRTSSIAATAANIGSKTTITINRATSAFTHTLTYSFNGLTGTIATKTTSISISWTVPTSFYAKIPNAKYGTCTITCETFNGDTSIGTSTTTFRATASESLCKPTLNPSVFIPNSGASYTLTGSTTRLIQYYSWPSYTSGATAKNGATIKSIVVKNGDYSSTDIDGRINAPISTDTVSFTVTDSRGYTATKDVKVNLVNYIKLTCNLSASAPTPNGDMSFSIKGNYFNGSFGAVNNSLRVSYRYKVDGGEWIYNYGVLVTLNGNSYSYSGKLTGLDYQSSYTIQAIAEDSLHNGTFEPYVYSLSKAVKTTPIFDWGENDFKFNVPVYINEDSVPSIAQEGTSGEWTYRLWSDGTAECWANVQFTTNISNAWGNLYTSGSVTATNLSFPFTFKEIPVVTASLSVMSAAALLMPPGGTSLKTSTTQTGAYELVRPNQITSGTFLINYNVRGRWK